LLKKKLRKLVMIMEIMKLHQLNKMMRSLQKNNLIKLYIS
jgi:hypothetical protein